jgi:uncharacterized repeat protein (TIGR02543 family)
LSRTSTRSTSPSAATGASVAKLPDQPAGYFIGQQVALTATAAPGWQFVEWSGDATGTSPATTVTITAQTNVTATFAPLGAVTLTTSTTGNGTGAIEIDPEQDDYAWGTQVTLTAMPGPDSVFAGWSGDVTSSANPLQLDDGRQQERRRPLHRARRPVQR